MTCQHSVLQSWIQFPDLLRTAPFAIRSVLSRQSLKRLGMLLVQACSHPPVMGSWKQLIWTWMGQRLDTVMIGSTYQVSAWVTRTRSLQLREVSYQTWTTTITSFKSMAWEAIIGWSSTTFQSLNPLANITPLSDNIVNLYARKGESRERGKWDSMFQVVKMCLPVDSVAATKTSYPIICQ